jgi:hypothetical protein
MIMDLSGETFKNRRQNSWPLDRIQVNKLGCDEKEVYLCECILSEFLDKM